MDTSNVINLGLLIVTTIATIVSIIAVVDARRSRTSASADAGTAKDEANRATEAAEGIQAESARIAQGIQAMNEREDAREARRVPWIVERVSKERWKVINNTGAKAEMVDFKPEVGVRIQMEDGRDTRDVPPGQPVFISFGGGITDPATATIVVDWFDARREHFDTLITLG